MSRNRYLCIVGLVLFIMTVGFVTSLEARSKVGPRIGYYFDANKLFLGVDLLTPIAKPLYFNPNVEYVFSDNATFMTFNADFHYDFPSPTARFIWLGAGLAGVYLNPDGPADGNNDLGINLLAGVGFGHGSVTPYIQAKTILSNNTEFVIGFGVRF